MRDTATDDAPTWANTLIVVHDGNFAGRGSFRGRLGGQVRAALRAMGARAVFYPDVSRNTRGAIAQLKSALDRAPLASVTLIGCSSGGFFALYARDHPAVAAVVTFAGIALPFTRASLVPGKRRGTATAFDDPAKTSRWTTTTHSNTYAAERALLRRAQTCNTATLAFVGERDCALPIAIARSDAYADALGRAGELRVKNLAHDALARPSIALLREAVAWARERTASAQPRRSTSQ